MQNQEGPTGGTTVPTALQPSSKVPVISLNSQHVQKGDPSPTVVPQPYSSYLRQPEILPGSAEEENMMGPGQGKDLWPLVAVLMGAEFSKASIASLVNQPCLVVQSA